MMMRLEQAGDGFDDWGVAFLIALVGTSIHTEYTMLWTHAEAEEEKTWRIDDRFNNWGVSFLIALVTTWTRSRCEDLLRGLFPEKKKVFASWDALMWMMFFHRRTSDWGIKFYNVRSTIVIKRSFVFSCLRVITDLRMSVKINGRLKSKFPRLWRHDKPQQPTRRSEM